LKGEKRSHLGGEKDSRKEWAKQQRSKGKEIKIGFDKIRVGFAKYWNEIEKEEKREENRVRIVKRR